MQQPYYGRAATGDDSASLEKSIVRFQFTLMIFNVISLLIGLATFSVCIWIRFDLDFWEWVVEIDWYSYWYAMYVILVTMILVIINSVIGIFAVYNVSKAGFSTYRTFFRAF